MCNIPLKQVNSILPSEQKSLLQPDNNQQQLEEDASSLNHINIINLNNNDNTINKALNNNSKTSKEILNPLTIKKYELKNLGKDNQLKLPSGKSFYLPFHKAISVEKINFKFKENISSTNTKQKSYINQSIPTIKVFEMLNNNKIYVINNYHNRDADGRNTTASYKRVIYSKK